MGESVKTLCRMCETNCGIEVLLEGGRVVGVKGNPWHPLNGPWRYWDGALSTHLRTASEEPWSS